MLRVGDDRSVFEAAPLYDKIRPDETSWYIESGQVVITLQKLLSQKWPALTDKEALEQRFGPLNLSSPALNPKPLKKPEKDGMGAMEARQKVDNLLRAAQKGNLEALKAAALELAEKKIEKVLEAVSETKDATGRGCLHFAAHKGHLEVVTYLLEEIKVPVDARDDGGETPLMLAARESHLEVAQKLLEHGADPKAGAVPNGAGAIHQAAGQGRILAVIALGALFTYLILCFEYVFLCFISF